MPFVFMNWLIDDDAGWEEYVRISGKRHLSLVSLCSVGMSSNPNEEEKNSNRWMYKSEKKNIFLRWKNTNNIKSM